MSTPTVPDAMSPGPLTPTATAPVAALRSQLTPFDALCLTVWGEARNQPAEGVQAVAQTILTRVTTGRWGHTIQEVVFARKQYSCWGVLGGPQNAKNNALLLAVAARVVAGTPTPELDRVRRLVKPVYDGAAVNRVGRATHYVTVAWYNSPEAQEWVREAKVVTTIRDHIFLIA